MSSAFRTFTSAAGVGSACYLLATSTWDQVLLLFLAASLGWCFFVSIMAKRQANAPRIAPKKVAKATPMVAARSETVVPAPAAEPPRKVYKFPIHQLAGATIPKTVQAFE
ncbi:MAG: hypothetical protein JST89_04460 [Cyanobacteria bacterium SZAS-4]|nr:hypothetical protein [Cyanobacteria bacterium SZAS-4]